MAKHVWKTKPYKSEKTGSKDLSMKWMICQNSDLEHSKYSDWYLEDAPCNEWVLVDAKADACLCWKCTIQIS